MDGQLIAFLGLSAVVIMTPGQDTALTIRSSLLGGFRAGSATAAGVAVGQLAWTLAASAGVTAILVASEPLFLALRLAGAAYLIYLGARSLLSAIRGDGHDAPTGAQGARLAAASGFRQGLLSNLGNPKMAVFFSSLLPQFVPADGPAFATMFALGAIFATFTLAWLCGYAAVVERAGGILRRPRVRRAFDAITGVALMAFGGRLAAQPR